MSMQPDRKDGRAFGRILLIVGIVALAIAAWRFFAGESGAALFASGAMICAASAVILGTSKRSSGDVG